jgi:polysaccharide biosynthesis transport protein
MSQDNRLLPLTGASTGNIDRPLRDLTQSVQVTGSYSLPEPTHLRDYLNVVLKRKWLILSLITIVTTLVAIQMYRLPSIYEAHTTIQIEQRRNAFVKTKDIVINAGADPAYWNTQLKLLENPSLHRQVILRLGLQNNPAFLGGQARPSIFTTLRRVFSRGKAQPDEQPQSMDGGLTVANEITSSDDLHLTPQQLEQLEPYEDALAANLTVDPIEHTNLVEIHFKHNDPELARQVPDTLAQVFIEDDNARESAGAAAMKESTAKQINDLSADINRLEKQNTDVLSQSGAAINPEIKGANEIAERVTQKSTEALTAEAEVTKLQAEYDAAQKAQAASDIFSIPKVQQDKQIQDLQVKLAELKEKEAALLQQYTSEWPEVKKIRAQIKQAEDAQKRLANAIVIGMSADLEGAKKRAATSQASYNRERAAAQQQGIELIGLTNIQQQLTTDKQMLNALLQRKQELDNSTVNDQAGNVFVQTPARTPQLVGPPRVRNIIIALLLSLGAGIGLAFLLDYLDDTLKSIEDVDRHIHLPTLALIPAPREARRLSFGRNLPAPHEAGEGTALALIEEVRSPVAEAYRHLRTSLLLSSAGQPPRMMLVTSSQPSEGKTTTAVNTAMMLAQTGAEVLIIDCDLRRPRVHTHFSLPNARGITNYLSGETNIGELVQTYDKQANLKIITSGPVPPNAAELLGSEQMRRLLQLLADNFTHIIIDSPPVISFTDASILSTMVDGVVLVVHGGRSSRAVVRRAKQQLLDVGAHLFGIVLNNVKPESNDYYYGYGYYSNYYASDAEEEEANGTAQVGAGGQGT